MREVASSIGIFTYLKQIKANKQLGTTTDPTSTTGSVTGPVLPENKTGSKLKLASSSLC